MHPHDHRLLLFVGNTMYQSLRRTIYILHSLLHVALALKSSPNVYRIYWKNNVTEFEWTYTERKMDGKFVLIDWIRQNPTENWEMFTQNLARFLKLFSNLCANFSILGEILTFSVEEYDFVSVCPIIFVLPQKKVFTCKKPYWNHLILLTHR